jgi:hypothetical protein
LRISPSFDAYISHIAFVKHFRLQNVGGKSYVDLSAGSSLNGI